MYGLTKVLYCSFHNFYHEERVYPTTICFSSCIISRNYRQIWRPNKRMRRLVLCIIGGVYEQNSILKNVRVDDWTSERMITNS